jgi:hypothetical protein
MNTPVTKKSANIVIQLLSGADAVTALPKNTGMDPAGTSAAGVVLLQWDRAVRTALPENTRNKKLGWKEAYEYGLIN